ncbi:MAG TPA: M18 family aminopeptidase [Chlamydiales bacterium]|nr:M18 family aminopeptidase [Chlamydiales bacterium]
MQILKDFFSFLHCSPTVFHAAETIVSALKKQGFVSLNEEKRWQLEPGQGYVLTRSNALVTAFKMPDQRPRKTCILASHIDSPCLKIKPCPQQSSRSIHQLNTEIYGAPLLHSWLDRDLYVAGRLSVLDQKGKRVSHLVQFEEFPIIIPQLALHLDRSDKDFAVNKQDHLRPIFSLSEKGIQLEDWLKKKIKFQSLSAFDLFLVPKERPSFVGFESEFIASYRLDNLTSAFAALYALIEAEAQKEMLQMAFFWDHEEIGSMSCLGANSCFANEILERICLSCKMDREDFFCMKNSSICLSSDLAHGFHPSFSEKYDPQNAPLLGSGPVIKFNANQKYATNSETAAYVVKLAKTRQLPLQTFASRSDIPSGSTVGSIMASQLGMATVDLGIAGWAMHSIRETIAAQDEIALCALLKAALEEG